MLVFKKHKTRKFTLIILLFLGSVCQATNNYYVATNGWDWYTATQAQNPATPWRTLTHALDTAYLYSSNFIVNLATGTYVEPAYWLGASKNGKTIVIQGASSDANDTIFSSFTDSAFAISSLTTGNITWKNMTIKSTYTGSKSIICMGQNYNGAQFTFDNCILGEKDDTVPGGVQCIYFCPITASPPTRKITLIDSYCYGKDNYYTVQVSDIGTLTINNTLIDGTNVTSDPKRVIFLAGRIGTVTINNGSIIKGKKYGLKAEGLSSFAVCEVNNVTFDCNDQAITITDSLQQGTFANITSNNGIFLGHVYEDCHYPLGQIIVQDCNLIHTAADVNAGVFGLVIGFGVTGAEVSNNNVLDFAIALSLKGTFCNIHHNIFRGGNNAQNDNHAVYLRSAQNCLFENNTVYALGNDALMLYDQNGFPPDPNTDYNTFVNNIFDASGGGLYAIYLRGPEVKHNLFDYNCYVAGSKALAHGGYYDPNKYSLSGLQAWWAANGGTDKCKRNESHSIDTAPQFVNPANSDFHLKSRAGRWDPNSQSWVTDANTSPCIDAGDPNSDWTLELWPHGKRINMGAYGGTPEASMSLSNVGNIADLDNDDRVDYNDMGLFVEKWLYQQVLLPEDLDRNGAVNFIDFAEFAKHWLEDSMLRVTISPQEAIDAGAQWRRVGTSTWLDSGYTEHDVAAGSYMVEFKNVPGWAKPANLPVSVIENQLTEADAVYMPAITIGTGTEESGLPLATSYHDARAQTIYLASEIGGSYTITALALYVTTVPGQTMNNFTIRMKHTDLSYYVGFPIWESSDWITVYQMNETITTTGWVKFNFTTPFEYNGSQNLMVDISFNNSFSSTDGLCYYSAPGGTRTIYYRTNSSYGDPLDWSGRTPIPFAGPSIWNVDLFVVY